MAISDMNAGLVELFHDVCRDHDGHFALAIQFLNIGSEGEVIRYLGKDNSVDYSDIERVKKAKLVKVSKASPVYEYDTGKRYIIEVNQNIFDVLTHAERTAMCFYALSHINIYFGRDGNTRFSLNSSYSAERNTTAVLGSDALPKPEVLAGRFNA